MTGPDTETLTAALRRLADEHASGLLSVATPGRDVVLELADGVPVGIGPPDDVGDRVGREANAELVAAAVIDSLVDRTVAAIVGGGGEWIWDVADSAAMMPVPPDLATELSRRAVDAAQALATLAPDQVLLPARDLETHGEVDRVRDLFDGDRTLAEVADLAGMTVAAAATVAAALVSAGVLSTGQQESSPRSWTDAVAGSSVEDDDEDEPELWVMDPPDDEDDGEDEEPAAPAARATPGDVRDDVPEDARWQIDQPDAPTAPTAPRAPAPTAPAPTEPATADLDPAAPAIPTTPDAPAAAATAAAGGERAADPVPPTAEHDAEDDWADTTWLDELGVSDQRAAAAASDEGDDEPGDARAALSAMITDLQDEGQSAPRERHEPDRPKAPPEPATPPPTDRRSRPEGEAAADDADAAEQDAASDARRKEPKAAPGEVAEFLRELSRLALDDE